MSKDNIQIEGTNDSLPLVSVCVQTYQHVNYIRECLEGILMQKTSFQFEIVIGEDESNDGTREICVEYAEKNPDKIRLFLRSRKDVIYINDNPSGRFNFIENLKATRAKYIALCEGDDYWTDPLKLQKQVDVLEANPEYGICAHVVKEVNEFKNTSRLFPIINEDSAFGIVDYIANNLTGTCSLVFCRDKFSPIEDWFFTAPFGDIIVVLKVMKNTNHKIYILKDSMSVYRVHHGGVHGRLHENTEKLIEAYKMHLVSNSLIRKNLFNDNTYQSDLVKKEIETYKIIFSLINKRKNPLRFIKYYATFLICKVYQKTL
ncbi:glycosyltransferase [Reichenbachiella sp. MALMAid0571]|uniref:glycosyltransferase family 2 protein n=1 Tax=Reichenbachiella sp. MALMAid0571 TaxID=3143939 RepID=UPI0032E047AF